METQAPPTAARETESVEPDRSEAGRKRAMVAVTVVLTVWGAIFLWVFSVWVAGTATRLPTPRDPGAGGPQFPMGPAGPTVPVVPPGGREPGHEGHDHGPGGHSHDDEGQ